jgi:hypothetical protein
MVPDQMPLTNGPIDGPDPILSVGITGHRSIAAEPVVSGAVEAAITSVLRALQKRSRPSAAAKQFASSTRFRLKVVSMLAEGADLLGMQAGLDCGAELSGVLPFDEQSYRKTFATSLSRALFDNVLSKLSSILVLSGFVGDDGSYEEANRAILDRSDVLIAVWDGDPARGRGGTGDVVHEALKRGLPVIVIRPCAETTPMLLGIAGETSICVGSLDFPPHIGGAGQQPEGVLRVRARVDPPE